MKTEATIGAKKEMSLLGALTSSNIISFPQAKAAIPEPIKVSNLFVIYLAPRVICLFGQLSEVPLYGLLTKSRFDNFTNFVEKNRILSNLLTQGIRVVTEIEIPSIRPFRPSAIIER